jgi:uncharacterized protein (DUF433 family)
MELDDYFDFQAPDDIRIKGHRIGIETVLYEYVHRGQTAEEIQRTFQTLSLEEVYATILYYLHNRGPVSKYLSDWLNHSRGAREQSQRAHAEWYEKMRLLQKEREGARQPQPIQS